MARAHGRCYTCSQGYPPSVVQMIVWPRRSLALFLLLLLCLARISAFVVVAPAADNSLLRAATSSVVPTTTRRSRSSSSGQTATTTTKPRRLSSRRLLLALSLQSSSLSSSSSGYVPPSGQEGVQLPSDREDNNKANKKKKKRAWQQPLYPQIGDIVRYYDLDGGKVDGQELVGKISFIQKIDTAGGGEDNNDGFKDSSGSGSKSSGWLLELNELDDTGDGYYAEYSSRQRSFKKATRDLAEVSPIAASFVRSESAFKVPLDAASGTPLVRAETYDYENYQGPFAGPDDSIDESVIAADAEIYNALKGKLLRYAAIAGAAGTLIADLVAGTEDAVIYAAGASASILYLFFLALKTDTIAKPGAKMGSNIADLRFATPLLVLVCVALYNKSLGQANPVRGGGMFASITTEQFAAAIIGFLTYRLPLFLVQLLESLKDDESEGVALPGSVGVAMRLGSSTTEETEASSSLTSDDSLATVFVVSGPQATGRSELVARLVEEGKGKFVLPKRVDRVSDAIAFERYERRDEFLSVDNSGGITKEGILSSARETNPDQVVVVDADVETAEKLAKRLGSGARLIGVWVGLNSVEDFEERLGAAIDRGEIAVVGPDETRESVLRSKIKEIVAEIEYGISSGIFEFTIINENEQESLQQLREAASYCFTT